MPAWLIAGVAAAYLGVLFGIAHYAERRAGAGRSMVTPTIYALSLAVYATSWTFYGSVGRAAATGVGFLPVYLGPTIIVATWWIVLRKVVRISKAHRITSIADFIASRYDKSALLAGLVSVIAVVGIIPYISLQLKAVSNTFSILQGNDLAAAPAAPHPWYADQALWVAMLLAAFAILFGARHLDATERHEGMVAAVAFESVVKLVAFLAAGLFVTYGMFNGFGDVFGHARDDAALARLLTLEGAGGDHRSWLWLSVLSALAVMFLPRQFQVAVVENVDERHIDRAMWLFPLYLLVINLFVLPITFAGLVTFGGEGIDADMFVLALPLVEGQRALALVVFVGGLSAATAMVIVESIALSTMVSNDLVIPFLIRSRRLRLHERRDLSWLILAVRRGTIVAVLLLGYGYFRLAGEAYALVTIGLVSFAAVAQFAPAFLFGLFWRRGTRRGALAGLSAGFVTWAYTLLLPSFVRSGWLPDSLIEVGPFGIEALNPVALLGLNGLDDVSHAFFWSMLANIGCYLGVSLFDRQTATEHGQAALFVDALSQRGEGPRFVRGSASVQDLHDLLVRFLGAERAEEALAGWEQDVDEGSERTDAGGDLVGHVEHLLTGTIGSASARAVVASVVDSVPLGFQDVMDILDETSQAIAHSRELEQKSAELERATAELRAANVRLTELDRLKDDFISTVTHELRTPLTSIRSFSEILFSNPDLETAQRVEFLGIIISESERLTRLINQVLDLSKLESGRAEWNIADVDLAASVQTAVSTTSRLFEDSRARIELEVPDRVPSVSADEDRVMQVLLNLLGNAAKFCDPDDGFVGVRVRALDGTVQVDVRDNGPGLSEEEQAWVFEKFRQAGGADTGKPTGTGLGLPISHQIVQHLGGRLWVYSVPGEGATFSFSLPVAVAAPGAAGDGAAAGASVRVATGREGEP